MEAGAPKICSECGGDPSIAGGLAWWGRATGLPLLLALCVLGTCVLMAGVRLQKDTATIGGVKSAGLGMTVGEVRLAAAGDIALQRRLADEMLRAGEDFMFTGSVEWRMESAQGPGSISHNWGVGFPVRWLKYTATTRVQQVPMRMGAVNTIDEWRWIGLTARHLVRGTTGPVTNLQIDLPAAALVIVTVLVAAAVIGHVQRRWRWCVRAWFLPLSAACVCMFWPSWSIDRVFGGGGSQRGVSRNRTALLQTSPEGLASIAVTAAAQLARQDADWEAVVGWQMPAAGQVTSTGIGWPMQWANISVYDAVPGDEQPGEHHGLRVKDGIFRWRWVGEDGRLRSFTVPAKSVAVTLAPALMVSMGLHWIALGLRARWTRKLRAAGCCLRCGYSVA